MNNREIAELFLSAWTVGEVDYIQLGELAELLDKHEEEEKSKQREALIELKQAVAFFDKVKASSTEERRAAGRGHWDWVLSAARKVVEKKNE